MIYQLDKIMRDVRVCLDQIIKSKVVEAVRRVHMDAPVHLLECGHNFGDALYWGEHESGWVLLPKDFMRLVVFEMSDWERAVYSAISPEDPGYASQRSRFKGLRGTSQRPVCAIANRPEGMVLEFYSCKSTDAHVSRAVYIPYPSIDVSGGVDISERCYDAVVYAAASLTLVSCGEAEKGNSLSELSQTFLK